MPDPAFVNAQTMRDGNVHFHRFTGDTELLGAIHDIQCTHVMQAVSQFDQDDADVPCHRKQHFSEVFALRIDMGLELKFFQFRQAVHHGGDRRSEPFDQFVESNALILDDIVQESCHDGLCVQFPSRANFSDSKGMGNIRFPGLANLSKMFFIGKTESLQNPLHVSGRKVGLQFFGKIRERHHQRFG